MQIKIKQLKMAEIGLNKLFEQKLPVKWAYKLSYLQDELVRIEKMRTETIKKYGKDDGKGNFEILPESENFLAFVKEFEEFIEEEIDISFEKIPFSLLEERNIELSPTDLAGLRVFIDFEKGETNATE